MILVQQQRRKMDKIGVLLSELAEIRQGYQFRKKIENIPNGLIKVVQMANIINGKKIDYQNLAKTHEIGFKPEHFLKKEDVLFCARGVNNYALFIDEDINNTIAISQFFIIRTDKARLLPAYLTWYLGQPEAIAHFKANTLMSTVPLLNTKTIKSIKIIVPAIEQQKKIAEIYRLKEKEREITEQIINKKEKMLNRILQNSINNMESI